MSDSVWVIEGHEKKIGSVQGIQLFMSDHFVFGVFTAEQEAEAYRNKWNLQGTWVTEHLMD